MRQINEQLELNLGPFNDHVSYIDSQMFAEYPVDPSGQRLFYYNGEGDVESKDANGCDSFCVPLFPLAYEVDDEQDGHKAKQKLQKVLSLRIIKDIHYLCGSMDIQPPDINTIKAFVIVLRDCRFMNIGDVFVAKAELGICVFLK